MSSPLHLDVFVVPYRPIVGVIPPMGDGEATWPATSVSLISGERDAVLIDALLTPDDAGRVVDWIRGTGKNLTTIYITHGHGDHFFGLNMILAAFPNARAVTAAAVVPDARTQLSPDLMSFWNAIFPGQIPEHPIVPDPLDDDVIELEGHELHHQRRPGRHRSFDDRLRPELGRRHLRRRRLQRHPPVAGSDRPREATYIRDFNQSLSESDSAQELVDKMMVLHGDLGNPYTLWTAAQGVFEQGQGAPS